MPSRNTWPNTPASERLELRLALRARQDDFKPHVRCRRDPAVPGEARHGRLALTDLDAFRQLGEGRLPGLIGIEVEEIEAGHVRMRLPLREELLAPNGYLHAGTVVALADSSCGYGCIASLPEGATGFTTIELKTNFLRTTLAGTIGCEAKLAHGGRTTQIWDATVSDADGRAMALFRCTQLVLR
jgi:1,4-dihydroxy-2-naphthoyl-CoA hydrolase